MTNPNTGATRGGTKTREALPGRATDTTTAPGRLGGAAPNRAGAARGGRENIMPGGHYRYNRGWMAQENIWNYHRRTFDWYCSLRVARSSWNIPVTTVPHDATEVIDYNGYYDVSTGYSFVVPPKGKLKVELDHPNRAWFTLWFVGKWGQPEEGMLQNIVRADRTVATYNNPSDQARRVYLIVSDPAAMSTPTFPYRLSVTRSWSLQDPAPVPKDHPVQGIWVESTDGAAN